MNGKARWHALTAELAEVVGTAALRVAVSGAVIVAIFVVPLFLRYWVYFPR